MEQKQKTTITIYWKDNGTVRDNIRKKFGISEGMSVNGENAVAVTGEELAELRKYEADGFIELRNKEKNNNGKQDNKRLQGIRQGLEVP